MAAPLLARPPDHTPLGTPPPTQNSGIFTQPPSKACACCKRNPDSEPRVIAVRVDEEGRLTEIIGYIDTLGCGEILISRPGRVALLHPKKLLGKPVGMSAEAVLRETHGFVRPGDRVHYKIG